MPITKQQFELGIDTHVAALMGKLHAYLSEHREEAFARDELAKLVLERPSAYDVLRSEKDISEERFQRLREEDETLGLALDKLVDLGSTAERKIRGFYYYSYLSDLEM